MRELQLYPSEARPVINVVHRLQFVAGGNELVGWIDTEGDYDRPDQLCATALFRCSLATGASEQLDLSELTLAFDGPLADPALSPDGRFLVAESAVEGYHANLLLVRDARSPGEELPPIDTPPIGFAGLFFTPDGAALIAVRKGPDGEDRGAARFDLAQLAAPPKRFHEQPNPFTGGTMRVPVRNLKWKTLFVRPGWTRAVAATLSANGRFLAVVDVSGDCHVADLRAKRVIATLPLEGQTRRDRLTRRVAFDPAAKWVVRLANGRLFARPLRDGKAWQTKATLGYAHDFAFHPVGRVMCAVFRDGQARYLDPRTGAVVQAFKWAKKPAPLYSVAFAPDGLTCAAGGENGKVVLWDVDS